MMVVATVHEMHEGALQQKSMRDHKRNMREVINQ